MTKQAKKRQPTFLSFTAEDLKTLAVVFGVTILGIVILNIVYLTGLAYIWGLL